MEYIHGTDDFQLNKGSAVTLGKFDGIHTGHQKLIEIVRRKADEEKLLAVLFTFDSLPLSICPQKYQHFISTSTERRSLCEAFGIDVEIEYPFTDEFMHMEPEDFICRILLDKLHAKYVVVGTDYRFGKDRAGDAAMLVEAGEELGFTTIIVEKEKYQDKDISSTYIREELKLGHMETVNVLLNRPYNVTGVVSIGKQLGRRLDFPTINIYPTEYKLLPPNGVYATQTTIDGRKYYGVTNLGTKPTVSDAPEISVETYLFDFDRDVYGMRVDVEFIHFIRPEMKFEDVEGLKRQIAVDSDFARNMFLIG